MRDTYRETYREEACELLSELDTSLLELDQSPDDMDTIGRIFRALHTIKGSGSMFGFEEIAVFTHEVETAFDLVRNGKLPVTGELIDLTLQAGDHIRAMLGICRVGESDSNNGKAHAILDAFRTMIPANAGLPAGAQANKPPASTPRVDDTTTYRIQFRPNPNLFATGTNPILLLNELRSLGECKIVAQLDTIPDLAEMDPENCFTYWDVILGTAAGEDAIRDVFQFVEDDCLIKIDVIDMPDGDGPVDGSSIKRLGDILIERGDVSPEGLKNALDKQKRIGELLVHEGLVDSGKIEAALAEQHQLQEVRQRRRKEEAVSTLKVPAEKLDCLVDLVGELVTMQARLGRKASSLSDPELVSISEEVERLTAELRDNTMSIRMLPIGSTFNRFKRLIRDLSRDLGKQVELVTEGAETELDKTVIERLNDPLVHLIRNSLDHGIEHPDVRAAAGKPRQGTVHLSAFHSGANVLIRIADDGAGLNAEAIREKAIQKGLIAPDAEMGDKELYSLIFAPGFSTAKEVTNVSGRGVGMDVVKRSIDALRGSIDISSRLGVGTTISLKLPLTLAIIDGLLVLIGASYYVIPLSSVEECVDLKRTDAEKSNAKRLTYIRGELVPYISLRERFEINGHPPAVEQIVITEVGNAKVGFVVDKVIGEHQTVIKNLGKIYRNVEGISGATILGDGSVALILDVGRLAEITEG